MHRGVGQQAQDGGEAVQLLLDDLWKLLVLLVPVGMRRKRRKRRTVRKLLESPKRAPRTCSASLTWLSSRRGRRRR